MWQFSACQWWWMLENCVKSKNAKFADDNEFVNNHWQCTSHSKKAD